MTGHDASRPAPLPIRPRPAPGEPVSSYIRRLAIANHLRPSYLHGYLAGPPDYLRAIQPERLAALSGRTVAVPGAHPRRPDPPARDTPGHPSSRVTRAADKPGLFAAIRRDAQDGPPIRALAARHRVHRRTIGQALADPVPLPRKTPRRTSALDQLHDPIVAMLTPGPALTIRQIWEQLLDDHDAAVSYASVRDYATRLRSGAGAHEA